jgi:endonuclease/exonuclease/phosphatase family metal-dependent hydrolase
MSRLPVFLALLSLLPACSPASDAARVRVATFNVAMGLDGPAELRDRLQADDDPGLASLAEVLQRVRPDIVLLNEFDYTPGLDAATLLNEHYLDRPWNGQAPIHYEHSFSADVNTGVDSGLDLDGNGRPGDPGDAWGFGRFPGQYGMLVLSRFAIDASRARTFPHFQWRDMPGALAPVLENGEPYYAADTWARLRLSSKSHWDLPLSVRGSALHLLASHPTPSVFDGPEDRNGRRNHDEIRLWADYIEPGFAAYLHDDRGVAGGLTEDARFVIAGDLNADPYDGDSAERAIWQLLDHPRIDASCVPQSRGGVEAALQQAGRNADHRGDPAADTSDFNDERVGNLRLDYVLPSKGLRIVGCGVFWPAADEPGHALVGFSDHRLVWLDITLPLPAP